MGDKSPTGIRISSLALSFFDFLGDLVQSLNFAEPSGTGLHTDSTSGSTISTSSAASSVVVLSFLSDFAIIFRNDPVREFSEKRIPHVTA